MRLFWLRVKRCNHFPGREGEQCLVVTKGELFIVVGEDEINLQAGDSIFFDSTLAHSASNNTNEIVSYVWSVTPSKVF